MPLIRGHHSFDDQFTQIPNEWLRDKRLSLATRGLLAQIMSHRPGWSITLENLAFANGVGRDAIRTSINQLLEVGYLTRSDERERNSRGQVAGYIYTTQTPPMQDEPTADFPTQGKLPLKNNNPIEEQSKEYIARSSKVNPDFQITDEMKIWATTKGLTIDLIEQTELFIGHYLANGRTMKDWQAAWRNWMLKANKWAKPKWEIQAEQQVIESKTKAEKERESSKQLIAEMRESAKVSVPAPKCVHGQSIVRCRTCIRNKA